MNAPRDPDLARRKFNDAGLVLPIAGTFLLMPPFIRVFVTDSFISGIPVIIVYLFSVWFALILVAWWLAGPLREAMQSDPTDTSDTEPPAA
jgi:hypothetical protein